MEKLLCHHLFTSLNLFLSIEWNLQRHTKTIDSLSFYVVSGAISIDRMQFFLRFDWLLLSFLEYVSNYKMDFILSINLITLIPCLQLLLLNFAVFDRILDWAVICWQPKCFQTWCHKIVSFYIFWLSIPFEMLFHNITSHP